MVPLGPGVFIDPLNDKRRTLIMSILNVTPDSFSDGGKHFTSNLDELQSTISGHISDGADIIDIGGQSSRPGAADVTAVEECNRVLPAIAAVRSLVESKKTAISVDTYRADVAKQAILAGAHIVNDITGGLHNQEMLETVAQLGCTYVLMHMRGTPETMASKDNCAYKHGVAREVADELTARLSSAIEAGIRRWRIVLDPGVGFAKDLHGNVELLRRQNELREDPRFHAMPWLIGTSKKRFVRAITGEKTSNKYSAGTASTVTIAIAQGADIIRVHDVAPMHSVAKMADAVYRQRIPIEPAE